jgi:hypothetical protein
MKARLSPGPLGHRVRSHKALTVALAGVLAAALATVITPLVTAGADGNNTTYYACVTSAGAISKVGTTSPSCARGSTLISWNQQGPQGTEGGAGPAGPTGPMANTCTSPPGPNLNFNACTLSDGESTVDWDYVNLNGTSLQDATLSYATLQFATLTGDKMQEANLEDSALFDANLVAADLQAANLTDATPISTNLTSADLVQANFTDADLTGANLTNANLGAATMTGAIVTNVTWSNTTCPDGSNSNNDGDTCVNDLT